jgi:hypothetical protein
MEQSRELYGARRNEAASNRGHKGRRKMNKQEILEHLKRKGKCANDRATFLMEAVYHRRKIISDETASSIMEILRIPICPGVVFGQLANNYQKIQREEKLSGRSYESWLDSPYLF